MINKKIIQDELQEDLSFMKTTYNLAKYNSNYSSCVKLIKNITLVPRSGTHNNFKINEEIIIYVINGELTYSDSLGNNKIYYTGNIIHIYSGNGISYDIFNNGIDFLDIVEINLTTAISNISNLSTNVKNSCNPAMSYSEINNTPINQWHYRISSINGLAPIKSFYDVNIYSLSLSSNARVEFTIGLNRQCFLFQGYGQSIFNTTINSKNNITLTGCDNLHISNETFEILGDIPSDLLLIETSIL
ncbi:MAG: pirin family protein [Clostridium sp.]|uniref:pirin family protein n=1 Tax=Clostridium sp. TaxID=1506 RepID=UPI0030344031